MQAPHAVVVDPGPQPAVATLAGKSVDPGTGLQVPYLDRQDPTELGAGRRLGQLDQTVGVGGEQPALRWFELPEGAGQRVHLLTGHRARLERTRQRRKRGECAAPFQHPGRLAG